MALAFRQPSVDIFAMCLLFVGSVVVNKIEEFCERTEHLDIFLFSCPSLSGVLFLMFCLLVEGECQILVS